LSITASTNSLSVGGAATFTISADQAPVEDTSVNYQIVGSAQPGKDFEPLLGTVLLRSGERSVTVTLRSINKDVVFSPTDMIVADWPVRVGQVLVKEGDSVPPGAALLSLTDPNFTVTLKANASDRTKLDVGQSCKVKLTGGDDEASGTISQLDETVTVDDQTKEESYEGKIDVPDLGAADGASVTIDCVVKERKNALTVPIAAVKQNGEGEDVVRVIDLSKNGHITEVRVKTGLSEGSYIEVTSGLKGNETVIVEVDQTR
jgi:multidrug efflux pump subunit AcrA (membrane-fusion protein)